MRRVVPVSLLALLLLSGPMVHAQEQIGTLPAEAQVTLAPPTVREVIAEGRAAIGETGVIGARRAAEAQALRNAVEKALGVYVSAQTLTQNYVMVRDQVVTNATGYATLKEVLKEQVLPQEVRVTVRAIVSLRPLAEQLKALKLTRQFRVRIVATGDRGTPGQHAAQATVTLEKALTDAGFVVVSDGDEADILVKISPRFDTVAERDVLAGDVQMKMYSVRGSLSVRASRVGTGEVVAALSAADTALHINLATARGTAAAGAMDVLSPKLTDALMVLPGALSQPVTLVVSGLSRAAQVSKLEESLNTLTGVRTVTRRSWVVGKATWELDVYSDSVPRLSRNLEETPSLRPFRLAVASETRARIVATCAPSATPLTKPRTVVRKGNGG
jgi:hypothetical protein